MSILNLLAALVILLLGIYFVILGTAAIFKPTLAAQFLLGFAENRTLHYLELFFRLIVGSALIQHAPYMLFANVYVVIGWLIVGTTVCLFILPWQWHHKFAKKVVPYANQYLKQIGVVSLILGITILSSISMNSILLTDLLTPSP